MPGIRLTLSYQKSPCGPSGQDDLEFLISTNPGEPAKPLGDVASGGELSRIMLAIKTVLADTDEIPTLIFDKFTTPCWSVIYLWRFKRLCFRLSNLISCLAKDKVLPY